MGISHGTFKVYMARLRVKRCCPTTAMLIDEHRADLDRRRYLAFWYRLSDAVKALEGQLPLPQRLQLQALVIEFATALMPESGKSTNEPT